MIFDTGSTFSFLPVEDFKMLLALISKAEPKCIWKKAHFVCPSTHGPEDPRFPILQIPIVDKVTGKIVNTIPFGPKQYFWFYPGHGLYLAVKPRESEISLAMILQLENINADPVNFWLMGNRFLQNFHQIYDYEHRRVALVLKQFDEGSDKLTTVPINDENVEKLEDDEWYKPKMKSLEDIEKSLLEKALQQDTPPLNVGNQGKGTQDYAVIDEQTEDDNLETRAKKVVEVVEIDENLDDNVSSDFIDSLQKKKGNIFA